MQARLGRRLGRRHALLGHDGVGGQDDARVEAGAAALSSSTSASAWQSCGPPRAVRALQVSATATIRDGQRA